MPVFTYNNRQWNYIAVQPAPGEDFNVELTEDEIARIPWDQVKMLLPGRFTAVLFASRGMNLSARFPRVRHLFIAQADYGTAFMLGLHRRVGEECPLRALSVDSLGLIVRHAFS